MTCRIGVIGCGRIAQLVHLAILTRMPGVQITALADPDSDRLEMARRRTPGARPCRDYSELLARPDLDAVIICGPSAMHAAAAAAAFDRGLHVYLEKPVATTLDDGRRVVDAHHRSGTVGMAGFNYRFNPLVASARRLLAAGRIGDVFAVRSVFTARAGEMPAWKESRTSGGGVLLDLGSHHVDTLRFLLGREVVALSARAQSRVTDADTAQVALTMEGGIEVQSLFAFAAAHVDRFEIHGSRGCLTFDRHRSTHVSITGDAQPGRGAALRAAAGAPGALPFALRQLRGTGHEPSYARALAAFVASIAAKRPAAPDIADGYRSLAVIVAAEESARTGRVIAMRDGESTDVARRELVAS